MIRTFRFVFKNDEEFYVNVVNDGLHKYYLAVFVLDVEERDGDMVSIKDVLSTSAIGILPIQLNRLRWQRIDEWNLGEWPLFKRLVREHFENREKRLHNVANGAMFGFFGNGLGPYAPEEIPQSLKLKLVPKPASNKT